MNEPQVRRRSVVTRSKRLGRYLIGSAALFVALSMTPLPSYANHLVVRTSDIVNGAVTRPKIRDGAVNTSKLVDGAVSRRKVRDGAVTGRKLGELVRRSVEVATTIPPGQSGVAEVECELGELLISGGASALPGNQGVALLRSFQSQLPEEEKWIAGARNDSAGDVLLSAFALCLRR